jgi:methyl-accepting chemotaxis protein
LIITALKHIFVSIWKGITGGIKSAIEEIEKGYSEILRYSLEIGSNFQNTESSAKALEGLTNRLKENMSEIAILSAQIQSSYRSIVQNDIEAYYLAQKNQAALRDSSNAVKDMAFLFTSIESSLQNAGKYLQDMASETLRQMERQARTIAEYIYDFVDSIWEGVRAGKDLVDVLKEAVEELAIAVAKAVVFQLIYRAVSSAIGLPIGPIPAFQSGGVVDRPTLALVGEKEREYIIPESKFPQPVVYVEVRNANPDTYAHVLVKMSRRAKRMVFSSLAGA